MTAASRARIRHARRLCRAYAVLALICAVAAWWVVR